MDTILHPSAFSVVVFGESCDAKGTLATVKNIYDNVKIMSRYAKFAKPTTTKKKVPRTETTEKTTKTPCVAKKFDNKMKVNVFLKNVHVSPIYASQLNRTFSDVIASGLSAHVASQRKDAKKRRSADDFVLEVYILEEKPFYDKRRRGEPVTKAPSNWWNDKCTRIWPFIKTTTTDEENQNSRADGKEGEEEKERKSSVIDQFREFGEITTQGGTQRYGDRKKGDSKFEFCPIVHCRSKTIFSKFDFERALIQSTTDHRIQKFELKRCIKLDDPKKTSNTTASYDEDDDVENDIGDATSRYDGDNDGRHPAIAFVYWLFSVFLCYLPFFTYAMVAFVALMCDYTEGDDRMASSYLLKFKKERSKKREKQDRCAVLAFSLRKNASDVNKNHGLLRTSASVYEYGTFFSGQIEKICTNWNGSFFSCIFLFFDYAIWYQLLKRFYWDDAMYSSSQGTGKHGKTTTTSSSDSYLDTSYLTYATILMVLFYYMQVHYCFHFLKSINLVRNGKPVSYIKRIAMFAAVSVVCPFFFFIFYLIMWVYRRIFSKRAWFSTFRCSKRLRNWLFPKENLGIFRSSSSKGSSSSSSTTASKKRSSASSKKSSSSSRWNCCFACCRPEHEEDDDDVISDLYFKSNVFGSKSSKKASYSRSASSNEGEDGDSHSDSSSSSSSSSSSEIGDDVL